MDDGIAILDSTNGKVIKIEETGAGIGELDVNDTLVDEISFETMFEYELTESVTKFVLFDSNYTILVFNDN